MTFETIQERYKTFAQFEFYCIQFGMALHLGFASAHEAWDANPLICVSDDSYDGELAHKGGQHKIRLIVEMTADIVDGPVSDKKMKEAVSLAVSQALENAKGNGFQHVDNLSLDVESVSYEGEELNG